MIVSEFFRMERERTGVTLEELCEGLYTPSMMMRIEQEKRGADRLYMERLLGRLGIACESYENYLNPEEYETWSLGQQILDKIDAGDFQDAKEKTEQYQKRIGKNKIGQQFCYAMLAQISELSGVEVLQSGELYEKAVLLTIPQIGKKKITERKLSVEECNLILEYYRCKYPAELERVCIEMLDTLEKAYYEPLTKVKIYPKVVVYLNQEWRKQMISKEKYEALLTYGKNAIEILRENGRTFYLPEVLKLQIENLEHYTAILQKDGNANEVETRRTEKGTLQEFYAVLCEVTEEAGVEIRIQNYNYIYRNMKTYCTSDVIRIRRKMLGMTKEELCDGICSVKTLNRIENRKSNPQIFILKGLFQRLHLAPETTRLEWLTKERKIFDIMYEMDNCLASNEYGKAERILKEAKQYSLEKYTENRQELERAWITIQYEFNRISVEERESGLKRILGYTMPIEYIFKAEDCFLTSVEMQCLQNFAVTLENGEKFPILEKIIGILEKNGMENNRFAMYETGMVTYASKLGNVGEFEKSSQISRQIMKKSLQNGRMFHLDRSIYGILWNQIEEAKGNFDIQKREYELKKCLTLVRLNKKYSDVDFFEMKLAELEKN